ncbi:MAG: Glu/Leu/Phe/Val dehydrogenase dimerization domain-containing protein [Pseudomonadota bacterium]
MENLSIFSHTEFNDHEQIVFASDQDSGLKAIIAIHDTTLGPSLGGCRVWRYDNENEALQDVLRLSAGMSYKAAISNLALGGGKAVILADPVTEKTPAIMQAFGRAIERLAGRYITAKDVGTSIADMDTISTQTNHVVGLSTGEGDPSPYTGLGVFLAMQTAVKRRFETDLKDITVSVKGLGNVGYDLCRKLHDAGARLIVADLNKNITKQAEDQLNAKVVSQDSIMFEDADVYAPCALGADLSNDTIPRLKAKIICGGANNQLATPSDDDLLVAHDITYCPDYLVNAGGLISVSRIPLQMTEDEVLAKIDDIPKTLEHVFAIARSEKKPTGYVANRMVKAMIGRV